MIIIAYSAEQERGCNMNRLTLHEHLHQFAVDLSLDAQIGDEKTHAPGHTRVNFEREMPGEVRWCFAVLIREKNGFMALWTTEHIMNPTKQARFFSPYGIRSFSEWVQRQEEWPAIEEELTRP